MTLCLQGRTVSFATGGPNKITPPLEEISPTSKLILCEIYNLISLIGLQKTCHSTPKTSCPEQGFTGINNEYTGMNGISSTVENSIIEGVFPHNIVGC